VRSTGQAETRDPLQAGVLIEIFRLFTVQLRHFTGEKIARLANRVRAIALSLLQLCVLRLGFLQDVGVGVFPEGEEVLVGGAALAVSPDYGVSTGKTEVGPISFFGTPRNGC
jgi:hypothetical protein